jgi:tRNA nucleotidyltransferase (CCA-adding enzyme)
MMLEIYLVGGAVRDQLLGLPVKERDWVVVGATPEIMLELGYRPVGKDFPVFLHPQTHEEYALARTERKIAPGYKGFHFYASPDVSLEEDLKRRDLTINAMAQASNGKVIDPFGGREDLKKHILRHVSSAFVEDPVRILRVARFAARFADFNIHPDTVKLMHVMVEQGEVNALVAERVWQEWEGAFIEPCPQRFFEVLNECGALKILFPELSHHNYDSLALVNPAEPAIIAPLRFAILLHTLDRKSIQALCQRYRVPAEYLDLALLVSAHYKEYPRVLELDPEDILVMLETMDAFRRPKRMELFLQVCEFIYAASLDKRSSERMRLAQGLATSVDVAPIIQQGLKGADIGKALRLKRREMIEQGLRKSLV